MCNAETELADLQAKWSWLNASYRELERSRDELRRANERLTEMLMRHTPVDPNVMRLQTLMQSSPCAMPGDLLLSNVADEIERLRRALQRIREEPTAGGIVQAIALDALTAARAAGGEGE